MGKIWNTRLDIPLKTTRLVRRVIIDEDLKCGWPVKWGGKYDVPINGKLVPTGESSLRWTGQQWIDFIKKQIDEY